MTQVDDDRLLRYALGLDDDPELREALAHDDELSHRLAAVVADLKKIDDGLRATVPPVEEGWDDLSQPRWDGLRQYLRVPREGGRGAYAPGRRGGRLAVLLVALAVAALLIAVVATQGGRQSAGVGSSAESTKGGGAALSSEGARNASDFAATVAEQARNYGTVAVAEAGGVSGGKQEFTVVRVLKGDPPSRLSLVTTTDETVSPGTLQLVYLDPVAQIGSDAEGAASGATGASGASVPAPSAGAPQTAGSPPYSYKGKPALVQPLPAEVDPATLSVP